LMTRRAMSLGSRSPAASSRLLPSVHRWRDRHKSRQRTKHSQTHQHRPHHSNRRTTRSAQGCRRRSSSLSLVQDDVPWRNSKWTHSVTTDREEFVRAALSLIVKLSPWRRDPRDHSRVRHEKRPQRRQKLGAPEDPAFSPMRRTFDHFKRKMR
jgi:hypothetical protein